ncbi:MULTISPECIES: hypothetical protein [unclassified Actinomyces]|uniref:hypothetical protein n=1 Tax=unclassified Actinomyces TaxID=2609248 RepID=UPI001F2E1294|nr:MULTISPECIES: hypothetical protein [unclassified Actinomyces]
MPRELKSVEAIFNETEESIRSWILQEGASRIEITINRIGLYGQFDPQLTIDGVTRRVIPPYGTKLPFSELRRAQAIPGRGAWTWCRLWMDVSDGVLHQECDWMREPVFEDSNAGAGEYAIELDRFPRDPEFVPEWLAERVAAYEKRKERNALRREARRRKREQERGG